MVSSDVWADGEVVISSSTPDSLHFVIESLSYRGASAYYSETAHRIASSSMVYVADKNTEDNDHGPCNVTIRFIDQTHVKYFTKDGPDESMGYCGSNAGIGASFQDGEIHEKDFKVALPTIKVLGFTDNDIAQFEALVPGVLPYAQKWLTEGASDKSAIKL